MTTVRPCAYVLLELVTMYKHLLRETREPLSPAIALHIRLAGEAIYHPTLA